MLSTINSNLAYSKKLSSSSGMITKTKAFSKFNAPLSTKRGNIASSVETSPNTFTNKLSKPFFSPNLQNKKVGRYMQQLNSIFAKQNKINGKNYKLANTFQERLEKFRMGDSIRNSNRIQSNLNKENIDWRNKISKTPKGGYENSPQLWSKTAGNGYRRHDQPSQALRMLNNFIERSSSNSRYKKLMQVCKVKLSFSIFLNAIFIVLLV